MVTNELKKIKILNIFFDCLKKLENKKMKWDLRKQWNQVIYLRKRISKKRSQLKWFEKLRFSSFYDSQKHIFSKLNECRKKYEKKFKSIFQYIFHETFLSWVLWKFILGNLHNFIIFYIYIFLQNIYFLIHNR